MNFLLLIIELLISLIKYFSVDITIYIYILSKEYKLQNNIIILMYLTF